MIGHDVLANRSLVGHRVNDHGRLLFIAMISYLLSLQGGTHVNYIVDQVVSKLLEVAKKKNKGGMDLKPQHVKSQLWVFVNCLVENPSFNSQTKEEMTLKAKSFGSTCSLSDKFIKSVSWGVGGRGRDTGQGSG